MTMNERERRRERIEVKKFVLMKESRESGVGRRREGRREKEREGGRKENQRDAKKKC